MSSGTQFTQFRAQRAFERTIAKLATETDRGAERRHLDVYVEFLEHLLEQCGQSLLTTSYRNRLTEICLRVSTRHNLRLIQGSKHP